MHVWIKLIASVMSGLLLVCSALADDAVYPTAPTTKQGKPWRIAYYQGGSYAEYDNHLHAVVQSLMARGWIAAKEIPGDSAQNAKDLWQWLTVEANSDYLRFLPDGFYSAEWDVELRDGMRQQLLHRLSSGEKIDLVIAMGTWAGKDLANDQHQVPTLVVSASNPLNAGIIQSHHNSGYPHVHARVDPGRDERQLRVFHSLIGFQRLGVPYEDSIEGRSYANIEQIAALSDELGFEVVPCHTNSDIRDRGRAGASVIDCFETLVTQVDAIYLTTQGGVNDATIPQLVQIANRHRIPTFSQQGSSEVKRGLLMSLSRQGYTPIGDFLAGTMAKVMNGAPANRLEQVFEEPEQIAVNLKTAEAIGLYLYADLLAAADKLYQKIEPVEQQ